MGDNLPNESALDPPSATGSPLVVADGRRERPRGASDRGRTTSPGGQKPPLLPLLLNGGQGALCYPTLQLQGRHHAHPRAARPSDRRPVSGQVQLVLRARLPAPLLPGFVPRP